MPEITGDLQLYTEFYKVGEAYGHWKFTVDDLEAYLDIPTVLWNDKLVAFGHTATGGLFYQSDFIFDYTTSSLTLGSRGVGSEGVASFAIGLSNIVESARSFVVGSSNVVLSTCSNILISGASNTFDRSDLSLVVGASNIVSNVGSIVIIGGGNAVDFVNNGAIIGVNNIVGGDNNYIFGKGLDTATFGGNAMFSDSTGGSVAINTDSFTAQFAGGYRFRLDASSTAVDVSSTGIVTIDNVVNNNTEDQLLVWNTTTKEVEYRDVSSLPYGTGTITDIIAGDGMDFTTVSSGAATIDMGTPSTITLASVNGASGTTHSHEFDLGGSAGQYLAGDNTLQTFPTIPVVTWADKRITFGKTATNGLDFSNDLMFDYTTSSFGINHTVGGTISPTNAIDIFGNTHLGGNSVIQLNTASGTSATQRGLFQISKSRGTIASPTALVNGDKVGSFGFVGYDGSNFQSGALLEAFVDGTVSSGLVPKRLSFVTGSSSGTRAERLTIKYDGKVGVGTTSPNTMLHVTGIVTIGNVVNNNTEDQLLVWNVSTKEVEYRDVASLPGGGGGSGTVTSVGMTITGSTALAVSGSPITTSGTFAVTWTGSNTQYVAGDGSLITFPTLTSGTVTAVNSGAGMDFTNFTTSGTIILGTPSTITLSSTNAASGTTHSHEFDLGGSAGQYLAGDNTLQTFPTIPAQVNIIAGTGIGVTGSYPNITITNSLPSLWQRSGTVLSPLNTGDSVELSKVTNAGISQLMTLRNAGVGNGTGVQINLADGTTTYGFLKMEYQSGWITTLQSDTNVILRAASTDVLTAQNDGYTRIHNRATGTENDLAIYDSNGVLKTRTVASLPFTNNTGTVTNFSANDLNTTGLYPLFTVNVTNPTTTPDLSFTLPTLPQKLVFAAPWGISGTPFWRQLLISDLQQNGATNGQVVAWNTIAGEWTATTLSFTGTVTSVAAGNGMNFSTITNTGTVTMGTPSSITLSSSNGFPSGTTHTHAFAPGGSSSQYINGAGALATNLWSRSGTVLSPATSGDSVSIIKNVAGLQTLITLGNSTSDGVQMQCYSGGTLTGYFKNLYDGTDWTTSIYSYGRVMFRGSASDVELGAFHGNGRLLVGTGIAPIGDIHLYRTNGTADFRIHEASASGSSTAFLRFYSSGTGKGEWLFQTGNNTSTLSGRFRIFDDAIGVERFTILPTSGRTGVNKIAPTSQLHVGGDVAIDTITTGSTSVNILTSSGSGSGTVQSRTIASLGITANGAVWRVQGGTTDATTNTQDIYHNGKAWIGNGSGGTSSYQFQVSGTGYFTSSVDFNNNAGVQGFTTGAVIKNLLKLNASNYAELGTSGNDLLLAAYTSGRSTDTKATTDMFAYVNTSGLAKLDKSQWVRNDGASVYITSTESHAADSTPRRVTFDAGLWTNNTFYGQVTTAGDFKINFPSADSEHLVICTLEYTTSGTPTVTLTLRETSTTVETNITTSADGRKVLTIQTIMSAGTSDYPTLYISVATAAITLQKCRLSIIPLGETSP